MNNEKHPFAFKYAKDVNNLPYLGSDGLPMEETRNLYIKKCEEFKAKAKKYARDNTCSKNSMLHHFKYGYTGSEQLEEDVLLEREELMNHYRTSFDVTFFSADPNSMYECFPGKSKRIRVIRELHQEGNSEFSSDFDKKKGRWFTRYCILSRFIEVARKIILLNRLKKALATLRTLTPRQIEKIQRDTASEGEEGVEFEEVEDGNKELGSQEKSLLEIKPCVCDRGSNDK